MGLCCAAMQPALFFAVCVPLRVAIAIGVVFAGAQWPTATAATVLAGVVVGYGLMALNAATRRPDAWWSRPIHALFMAAIGAAAVLSLAGVVRAELLGLMIAADLAFGVGHALLKLGLT